MELAVVIGAFILGYVVAHFAVSWCFQAGTVRVDRSDPNKDRYRLDIDDFEIFNKKNYILLKVDRNADLSQK